MKQTFVPDKRNLGGKRDIENLQQNHLLALINVKPEVKSNMPPHRHVNSTHKSNKQNLKHGDEFIEVYEALKRVSNLPNSDLDNKCPQHYHRSKFIKMKIPKVKDIQAQNHQRNLKSLLDRLDNQEKKYVKRADKIKLNISVTTANKLNMSKSHSIHTNYSKPIDYLDYHYSNKNEEPEQLFTPVDVQDSFPLVMDYSEAQMYQHSTDNQTLQEESYENTMQVKKRPQTAFTKYSILNVPKIKQTGDDAYKELRRILLNIVMDHNMFDKEQILELAVTAKKSNPYLDKQKIMDICKNIIISLYGQL